MLQKICRCQLIFLLLAGAVHAAVDSPWAGEVLDVVDGDTLLVSFQAHPVRVRLSGIDALEIQQPGGIEVLRWVEFQCLSKRVKVFPKAIDRYDRTVADVILPGGRNLSQELIRAGWAWWYRQFAPKDQSLGELQAEAQAVRRGGWRCGSDPTAPWIWRKKRKTW
jgi:endonuclease YncB( thermonuclease family)